MNYYEKYLKYKNKYISLKKGGLLGLSKTVYKIMRLHPDSTFNLIFYLFKTLYGNTVNKDNKDINEPNILIFNDIFSELEKNEVLLLYTKYEFYLIKEKVSNIYKNICPSIGKKNEKCKQIKEYINNLYNDDVERHSLHNIKKAYYDSLKN
jgi:hypothetical protein